MKYKNIGVIGILAVMCLVLTGGAFAATSFITPTANSAVSGSYLVNVTETGGDNIVNVSFYYKLGSGDWVFIDSIGNGSAQQTNFNITWTTTGITDQGSVTVNGSAFTDNIGTLSDSVTVAGIDIDNTNPGTTYGSGTPGTNTEQENNSLTFDTGTDASYVNCTLTLSPSLPTQTSGNTSHFVTSSGSICIMEIGDIPDGSYSYYWTATDGLSSSTFSTRYVTIDNTDVNYVPPAEEVTAAGTGKKGPSGFGVVLVVLAIVGAIYWISKD